MSVDAGLHIKIETEKAGWPLLVLDGLLDAGWRMDDHGKLIYLPLGDDDVFEWTELPRGANGITEIFRAKMMQGEPLGVALTWNDTQIGGTVIIRDSGSVAFSASINRQCLSCSSTTDVSWYLAKLIKAVAASGVHISSWEWIEAE